MTLTNNCILKRYILVSMIVAALATLSGCGYSIWNYHTVERKLDNADSWSITFSVGGDGRGPTLSKISPDDTLSYTFVYAIGLKEKDTTKYERLSFRVDDITYRYSSEVEPIALKKLLEFTSSDLHVGAKSANRVFHYGTIIIDQPPPDTIWIEQDVTVFYLESGEELTSFHHVVKAVLEEGKYSHFRDFIQGT